MTSGDTCSNSTVSGADVATRVVMSRHRDQQLKSAEDVKQCHDNILTSRHQDQQLKTAMCLSESCDKIMMSRHQEQSTKTS